MNIYRGFKFLFHMMVWLLIFLTLRGTTESIGAKSAITEKKSIDI